MAKKKASAGLCSDYSLWGWGILIGGLLYALPKFNVNLGYPLLPVWIVLFGLYLLYKAYM